MSFPTDRPATWFVTGTSRGLGLELVTSCSSVATRSPRRPVPRSGCWQPSVTPSTLRGCTTDSLALPASTTDAYPGLREMTENHLKLQGNQLGNPVKGAEAIIRQVVSGEGPLRQLLGSDAHAYATDFADA